MRCPLPHRASGFRVRGEAQEKKTTQRRIGMTSSSVALRRLSTNVPQERNLRSQVEQLRAELDEAESGRQNGQAAQEALRKVRPASYIPRAGTVDPSSDRRSRNFAMTSMKEPERKRRLSPSSNLSSWYVYILPSLRGGAGFNDRQNTFDVHKFLRGELKALPLKPDPVVITGEGIPRTKGVRY